MAINRIKNEPCSCYLL